jgi:hypothetical protein
MISIGSNGPKTIYIDPNSSRAPSIKYNIKNNANRPFTIKLEGLFKGLSPAHSLTENSCFNGEDGSFTLQAGVTCKANIRIDPKTLRDKYQFHHGDTSSLYYGSNTSTLPVSISACVNGNASACSLPPSSDTLTLVASSFGSSVSQLALSVRNTALNAALTGNARTITITNNTNATINNVTYSISPALPSGTNVSSTCTNLAPHAHCALTITPGASPSVPSSADDPSSIFSMITILGDNATPLNLEATVLGYGSQYQSGYVFSIDDTTPTNQSVSGTVLALQNQAPLFPLGIIWASNGNYTCKASSNNAYVPCTNYDVIPGINELSFTPTDACNGSTDGACNTQVIVNYLNTYNLTNPGTPVNPSKYAAGLCTATIGGYKDWYLPAICEMGYFVSPNLNITNNCGSENAPLLQNIASNLTTQLATMQGPFWSSTEYSGADETSNNAWDEYFTSNTQNHDGKEDAVGVRCVRKLTQPN